jgi:hypothetical protein
MPEPARLGTRSHGGAFRRFRDFLLRVGTGNPLLARAWGLAGLDRWGERLLDARSLAEVFAPN